MTGSTQGEESRLSWKTKWIYNKDKKTCQWDRTEYLTKILWQMWWVLQRNIEDMIILINDTWILNINMAKGCLISTNHKKWSIFNLSDKIFSLLVKILT